MKIHKYAKLFPKMTGEDFAALCGDIKANGLKHPIWTLEGQILDGQNRYAACTASGVKPEFKEFLTTPTEYEAQDPLDFVISQNLNRRHLTDDQRAAIAAEIANSRKGKTLKYADSAKTVNEAAHVLQVKPRQVRLAKQLKNESPTAFQAVKSGKKSLNAAHEEKHPRKPKAPAPVAVTPMPNQVLPATPAPVAAHEPMVLPPVIEQPAEQPAEPAKITLKAFELALKALESGAEAACVGNQKERERYGKLVNALAGRLLNPIKKSNFAYGK